MASIGLLQIDFVANTAKFTSGVGAAQSVIERFASRTAGAMNQLEKALERPGIKLSAKITAPIVAFSAAAVKAADKNGDFADSVERLGLQFREALRPIGAELIAAFERVTPTIEESIRFVRGLAEAFQGLEPEVKRQVITFAAVAAAIGPALLALSAFATVGKVVASGLSIGAVGVARLASSLLTVSTNAEEAKKATEKLTVRLTSMGKATLVVAAAAASVEVGRFLTDEFGIGQKALAYFDYYWQGFTDELSENWGQLVVQLKIGWEKIKQYANEGVSAVADAIASLLEGIDGFGPVLEAALGLPLGSLGTTVARTVRAAATGAELDAKKAEAAIERLRKQYAGLAKAAEINDYIRKEVLGRSLLEIDAQLESQGKNGAGGIGGVASRFGEFLTKDIEAALASLDTAIKAVGIEFGNMATDAVPGLKEIQDLLAKAREIASGVQVPEVLTKRDLQQIERFNEALDRQIAKLAEIRELASKISGELDPRRAIRDRAIAATQNFFDGGIDAGQLKAYLTKLQKEMDEVVDESLVSKVSASIRGFSQQMSDAFADLVVDGKLAAEELIRAFAKLQVSLIANEAIFKPLASAIGTGITTYFGGGKPPAIPATPAAAAGIQVSGPLLDVVSRPAAGSKVPVGARGVAGGGGVVVNVIDQRRSGERPDVTESTGPDGRKQITVLIRDVVGAGITSGAFDKALGGSFGLTRQAARR